jgi:hypothetical protein
MNDFVYSEADAFHDVCTIFVTRGKWEVDLNNDDWWGLVLWEKVQDHKWTTT